MYRSIGDYQNALIYRKKELDYYIQTQGETNLETAQAYNNVGAQYRELEQYDKAVEYITKAYDIADNIGDDIAKAVYLNRLGRTFAAMGDLSTAHDKFHSAINLLPEDHPEAKDSRERLEKLSK